MAETAEYQKPVVGHITSCLIFFIYVFWSQYQNGIFKGKLFFYYNKFIISKPSNIIFPEVLQDLIFWLTVSCYIMPHNNVTWRNNILKNT